MSSEEKRKKRRQNRAEVVADKKAKRKAKKRKIFVNGEPASSPVPTATATRQERSTIRRLIAKANKRTLDKETEENG